MTFHERLRRLARREKGVIVSDPEGVLALLQIAKRLVSEAVAGGKGITVLEAFDKALPMAAVKDSERAWWGAVKVFVRHAQVDMSTLAILADAIAAQGKVNRFQAKGPKP